MKLSRFSRLFCTFCGWSALTCYAAISIAAEPESALQPNVAYRVKCSDRISYEVDFSAVVTAPYHAKVLKVWLPIPPSDNVQQITNSRISTFPEQIEPQIAVEPVYGNKFAYFEFHRPQGAQIIRHRFTTSVSNLHWNLDPARVSQPDKWPAAFQRYLKPQPIAESEKFQSVLHTIAPQRTGSVRNLFEAMSWINNHLTYNHVDASLQADAGFAFSKRHGHCSDYHGLCSTMGRALGFPTRVTYGLSLLPKNSPSHCKIEAFLPPYGWVSFDLSETQKMLHAIHAAAGLDAAQKKTLAEAAQARLWAGFRENSWLLVTKGTDYELAPRAARTVRVVRTIYAEADGKALPEPDPANPEKLEYGWMTVHKFTPSKPVVNPFKDFSTLSEKEAKIRRNPLAEPVE